MAVLLRWSGPVWAGLVDTKSIVPARQLRRERRHANRVNGVTRAPWLDPFSSRAEDSARSWRRAGLHPLQRKLAAVQGDRCRGRGGARFRPDRSVSWLPSGERGYLSRGSFAGLT